MKRLMKWWRASQSDPPAMPCQYRDSHMYQASSAKLTPSVPSIRHRQNIFWANIIRSKLNKNLLHHHLATTGDRLSDGPGDILYPHRNQLCPLGVKHHLALAHAIDSHWHIERNMEQEHTNKLTGFSSLTRWTNTVPVPLLWRWGWTDIFWGTKSVIDNWWPNCCLTKREMTGPTDLSLTEEIFIWEIFVGPSPIRFLISAEIFSRRNSVRYFPIRMMLSLIRWDGR